MIFGGCAGLLAAHGGRSSVGVEVESINRGKHYDAEACKSMKFMMYDSKKKARKRSRGSTSGGEKSRAQ